MGSYSIWELFGRLNGLGVGLFYLYHGLNGFFQWQKVPPQSPDFEKFIQALFATGFVMTLIKLIEVFAGVLLIFAWKPHLAELLLGPIVVMIVLTHIFLNFSRGWKMALVVGVPYFVCLLNSWDFWRTLWI